MEQHAIIPIPRCEIAIRPATLADIPFMDGLQKKYGKALGYFPTKQFEGYVETGGVLVAEQRVEGGEERVENASLLSPLNSLLSPAKPVGYIISRDRYLKRDELGVVFQLCVAPGTQRKLVGAALVREVFERSAYGCRLYCCWCAQDLDANYFWESLGFVPIAFRSGSAKNRSARGQKGRTHIFWQKRIGAGDVVTPYWYPFQTSSGAIRADRLVFPIPPGVHWKDVEAVALPRGTGLTSASSVESQPGFSPSDPQRHGLKTRATGKPKTKSIQPPPGKVAIVVGGRIKYVSRPGYVAPQATGEPAMLPAPVFALAAPKPTHGRIPRPKVPPDKIDPKYLAAARELRDRYLEQFNAGAVLPGGKYDVVRRIEARNAAPLLEQAA